MAAAPHTLHSWHVQNHSIRDLRTQRYARDVVASITSTGRNARLVFAKAVQHTHGRDGGKKISIAAASTATDDLVSSSDVTDALFGEEQEPAELPEEDLPRVAIVGRPNVGKSALFNRLLGRSLAIVHDEAGVTRDRLYARSSWTSHQFLLADTGGILSLPSDAKTKTAAGGRGGRGGGDALQPAAAAAAVAGSSSAPGRRAGRRRVEPAMDSLAASDAVSVIGGGGVEAQSRAEREGQAHGLKDLIGRQAAAAVEEANAIVFVVDGQAGPTAADEEIASWLRRHHSSTPVFLAVNKCESTTKGAMQAADFWGLGFTPIAVSAISGTGTGDLLDELVQCLPLPVPPESAAAAGTGNERIAISVVGRPNVGKSSIVNALLGEERVIVSAVAGTTRDATDTNFTGPDGQPYVLIDTAGIRRRAAVASTGSRAEGLSVNRALRAIRRSDVVALVIDAMQCATEQDIRLAEIIDREGKAALIVVNKWDTVPEKDGQTINTYTEDVREKLKPLPWAPLVFSSAVFGQRVAKILETARHVALQRAKRLTTATLNQVVAEAVSFQAMPGTGTKRGRIYYCTQAGTSPPTFVFFVNDAKLFHEGYRRFMENHIRENVDFQGTPIRLLWRSKERAPKPPSMPQQGAPKPAISKSKVAKK